MMTFRPFNINDAETILSWCKDKHAFRLWSADRYKEFPAQPEEIMEQYEGENMYPLTAVVGEEIIGSNATSPSASASQVQMPIRLTERNGKNMKWNVWQFRQQFVTLRSKTVNIKNRE